MTLVKAKFDRCHGILQICNAIDYICIEVEHPTYKNSFNLYDKDKNLNFVMQAIVDHNTCFKNVCAGLLRLYL